MQRITAEQALSRKGNPANVACTKETQYAGNTTQDR